jgi:molecular chaperone DnaK
MDAVAGGAASFVAGSDFYDHIHHDYAVRWFNPVTGKADYKVIIPRGTAYPTPDAIATEVVIATWDGQELLGIFIYEMGATRAHGNDASGALELVFDASGSARIMKVAREEAQKRRLHWLNEQQPTFLKAEPAAKRGERCFALEFGVGAGKRLTLTATDLRSGRTLSPQISSGEVELRRLSASSAQNPARPVSQVPNAKLGGFLDFNRYARNKKRHGKLLTRIRRNK